MSLLIFYKFLRSFKKFKKYISKRNKVTIMIFEQRICYMFNKFFSSFVKDLKNTHEEIKAVIKKHFKVIDKSSEEYYNLFWGNVEPHFKDLVSLDITDINDVLGEIEFIKGINLKFALERVDNKEAFWNYFNCLLVFASLYHEAKTTLVDDEVKIEDIGKDKVEVVTTEQDIENAENETAPKAVPSSPIYVLFVKVVKVLAMLQKGQDVSSELEDIVDDDVKALLSKIKSFENADGEAKLEDAADALPIPPMEFLESIENSKIASLAKDIAKEIDISSLNIEKPEDIAKMLDFSGENNFLGNIVSKVSSTLTEKIGNGELKQEDLMSEAMSMMGMLNGGKGGAGGLADMLKSMGGLGGMGGLGDIMNNPMFTEMMKMAKKGKVATKNSNGQRSSKHGGSSTRDRLRKKLEERKKQQDGEDGKGDEN